MPATSSQISDSSSTMRISAAMTRLTHILDAVVRRLGGRRRRDWIGGKTQTHPGAPPPGSFLGSVTQLDAASVVFQNFSDNGETETGPLLARRDIRLEQARAVLGRQA